MAYHSKKLTPTNPEWLPQGYGHRKPFLGFPPPTSNTTYTPNQFFDVVLPRSSVGCVRLVAFILRKTLGWVDRDGQPQDEHILVNYNELIEHAGLSRASIKPAIQEAITSRFINCVREGRPKGIHQGAISPLYELRWDEIGQYTTDPEKFQGFYAQEGNRTYIPNLFFDVLIPGEKLSVIRVVGAIIRNTIGWSFRAGHRRQTVDFSFTDLQRRTKISDRHTLSDALQDALKANYIVKVAEGYFDPQAGKSSKPATYGLKWLDSNDLQNIGSKTTPEHSKADRFKNHTGIGSKTTPGSVQKPHRDRFKNHTDMEIKQLNNTSKIKQQQAATAPIVAAEFLEIYNRLLTQGFDRPTARRLATSCPQDQILNQINWLEKRSPSKNPLGMLRKAIEENWPPPAQEIIGRPITEDTPGSIFAAHFYAGYHGNSDTPVANPSTNDIETATRFVERLLTVWPDKKQVATWGRKFGQDVQEHQRYNEKAVPSFVSALRAYGDEFFKRHQARREEADRQARQQAATDHQARYEQKWMGYLRQKEKEFKKQRPDDFAEFEQAREEERDKLVNGAWQMNREERLTRFDGEERRLEDFLEFFSEDVLDFWDWDEQLNPKRLNEAMATI